MKCELRIREVCQGRATNVHHRKLRSQGVDDSTANKMLLCGSGTTGCHGWIHAHVKESLERGWLVRSWQDPAEIDWSPA